MRKILSALCAGALSMAIAGTSFVPAQAAPVFVPKAPQATNGDVVQVQDWRWRKNRGFYSSRGGRDLGQYYNHRRGGWNRNHHRRGHYRGHYRGDNLGGAIVGGLITGAIVGSVLNNSGPVYRSGNAHVQWCYDRYRTYRASDNTYVPRVGVRAYCNSPYN